MLFFVIIYVGRFLAIATKTPYSPPGFLEKYPKAFLPSGPLVILALFFFRTKAGCKASTSTSLRVILTSTTEFTSANAKSTSLGYPTRLSLHTDTPLGTCPYLLDTAFFFMWRVTMLPHQNVQNEQQDPSTGAIKLTTIQPHSHGPLLLSP